MDASEHEAATVSTGMRLHLFVPNSISVPCLPQNISLEDDCSSDSIMLDWDYSAGAVSYTALAKHADGNESSCSTVGTGCRIQGLRCGETYFVSLLVTNLKCNITENLQTMVKTGNTPRTPHHSLFSTSVLPRSGDWAVFFFSSSLNLE